MFVYLVNGDTVKMTREQMLDNVIAKYGFEVEETIEFAYLCERGICLAHVCILTV